MFSLERECSDGDSDLNVDGEVCKPFGIAGISNVFPVSR